MSTARGPAVAAANYKGDTDGRCTSRKDSEGCPLGRGSFLRCGQWRRDTVLFLGSRIFI